MPACSRIEATELALSADILARMGRGSAHQPADWTIKIHAHGEFGEEAVGQIVADYAEQSWSAAV